MASSIKDELRRAVLFSCVLLLFASCGGESQETVSNVSAGGTGTGPCQPLTCESAGAQCGEIPDGCGKTLSCGGCEIGETCGGGGPNLCGTNPCVPKTCTQLGAACGKVSDGCGQVIDCGGCPQGKECINETCVTSQEATGGSGGTPATGGSGGSECTPGDSCDDGDACTAKDTCNSSGKCVGNPVSCANPPNICFLSSGVCEPKNGTCNYPYQASGTPCVDDGNDCTIDQCDGAGTCVHVAKAQGTPCSSGTCVGGMCKAPCQGSGTVSWNQTQAAWYANPSTAGKYACSAPLPSGSYPHGTTLQVTTNDPQKRVGNATATCSDGVWEISGTCDGKVIDVLISPVCSAPSPPARKLIAQWYVADLYRCADAAGLDYWVNLYESPNPQACTPTSNYDGTGNKDTCWRNVFRNSANESNQCYDKAQASGHVCDSILPNLCPSGSYYPWTSIVTAGMNCKFGP